MVLEPQFFIILESSLIALLLPTHVSRKEYVCGALRQTIRQNQILRKFISWKDGTLKLLWMT